MSVKTYQKDFHILAYSLTAFTGGENFEFEDQGKCSLFCLLGNMQLSSVASEIFKKNPFYSKVPPPPTRLLMHRVRTFCNSCAWVPQCEMSLSCPRCEKTNLKIIQSLLERFKYTKCWKPNNFWDLNDFSEEGSLTVQDKQGTHEQLSLNKQTQLWIIQLTTPY